MTTNKTCITYDVKRIRKKETYDIVLRKIKNVGWKNFSKKDQLVAHIIQFERTGYLRISSANISSLEKLNHIPSTFEVYQPECWSL